MARYYMEAGHNQDADVGCERSVALWVHGHLQSTEMPKTDSRCQQVRL